MKNKIKIFKYTELAVIFFSAFWLWYLADGIFEAARNNYWGWMIFFVSLFFIAWSLGAIIIRDKKIFLIVTILSLATQLFFTKNILSLAIVSVSFFSLYLARKFIKREIKSRLTVDIGNYLRVGRRFLILAIALMLAGQYYFSNSSQSVLENLPKIKFNYNQGGFVDEAISFIDPNLIKENKEALTVDEYILKQAEDELSNSGIIPGQNLERIIAVRKGALLREGRENISKMVKREVSGDEKMVDIFLEVIANRINAALNVNVTYAQRDMPVTHLIITAAIFLAVMGTGMILSLIFILLMIIIFKALVFLKVLSIEKKAVNMDVIKIG